MIVYNQFNSAIINVAVFQWRVSERRTGEPALTQRMIFEFDFFSVPSTVTTPPHRELQQLLPTSTLFSLRHWGCRSSESRRGIVLLNSGFRRPLVFRDVITVFTREMYSYTTVIGGRTKEKQVPYNIQHELNGCYGKQFCFER